MQMNLAQDSNDDNSDFIVGDVVVFIHEDRSDHLMTVTKVNRYSVLLDDGIKFAMNHLIRAASVAELKARHRLDLPVALFVSEVP
jgi:hypothetical protein